MRLIKEKYYSEDIIEFTTIIQTEKIEQLLHDFINMYMIQI